MPIPQSFIDELLAKTDIVSVIERYVPLKKKGSNYGGLCPFHNEKSPSFSVSPSKQFYYCFGCGASGNAIGFLMDYERMSFPDTIELLAGQAGLQVPQTTQPNNPDYQAIIDTLSQAAKYYFQQLKSNPTAKPAQQYLQQRGLSDETIKHFGLGYAPEGWDNLVKALGNNSLLKKAGLLVENENGRQYDRFRERIIYPIRDRRGRVIAFGGRILGDGQPKYLNSPETAVFHKGQELYGLYEARQANKDLTKLLVVEGYMDVISLAQHGVNYAVATLGTAITANHLRRLISTCQESIFCFDGDNAGQRAAWKALEVSLEQLNDQSQIKFCFMPTGEDPDSYIKAQGQQAFEALLNKAAPLNNFFFDHLSENINLETLDGRAQFIATCMPYLQKLKAPIKKELLLNQLADITRTATEKLSEWSQASQMAAEPPPIPTPPTRKQTQSSPVRHAISLILQHPSACKEIDEKLPDTNLPGLNLLRQLLTLAKANPSINAGSIIEHWRDKPESKHLTKLASMELIIPTSGIAAELSDTLKSIRLYALDHSIEQLMNKARQGALSSEERQQLKKLIQEKQS